MLELLKQNSRSMDVYIPFLRPLLPNLYKAFLVHQKNFPLASQHWNYFYLGYVPIISSFLSFLIYWQNTKKYFILLIIFAFLSFGAHTRLDLFGLLWHLPIFHSIENPNGYFIPLVIFLIALTSGQLFSIRQKIKLSLLTLIFVLTAIFTTLDLFLANSVNECSFSILAPKHIKQASFFSVKNSGPVNRANPLIQENTYLWRYWEREKHTQYELMLWNIGKINWYGNIHLGEYAVPKYYIYWNGIEFLKPENYTWILNPEYRGEVYFLKNIGNKAAFQYFSPNKIIAQVNLTTPDTLIINQNFDKYWKSGLLTPVNHNGLLAIKLDRKGSYTIEFVYVPLSFYLGLGISFITFIFIMMRLLNKKELFKGQTSVI